MGEQGLASMAYGTGDSNSVKHYYAGALKSKQKATKKVVVSKKENK